MAVEYEISSDVATIKDVAPNTQVARVVSLYSGQITYDDEAGSKFATATIDGKSQRVMLCIAVNGTVTYDDTPCLYSTVDGHRCLNIVSPTETGTPDDVPSVNETVVIDGKNVRAVRCILINATPVYDGVSSVCTFTGDDGKTHTAQLVNKITGGSVEVIVRGTSPLSLPDAVADSLEYLKAFGGTEQRNLPDGYTQVEYVGGTRDAYANLGAITIKPDDTIYCECILANNGKVLFGLDGHTRCYVAQSGNGTSAFAGRSYAMPLGTWIIDGTTVNTVELTSSKFTINGVGFTPTGTASDDICSSFAINSIIDGTSGYDTSVSYIKKFYIKSASGSYKVNLIPFRSANNVFGFYDMVSKTFLTNQGTGTFIAGGEAVPTPDAPMDIVSNNGVLKTFKTLNISTYDTTPSGAGIDITFDGVTDRRKWDALNDGGTGTKHYENGFVSIYMDTSGNNYFAKALVDGVVYNGSVYNTGEQIYTWGFAITKNIDVYCPTISADGTVETINVHGKNLFGGTLQSGSIGWSDGLDRDTTNRYVRSQGYIDVLPNTQYTLSATIVPSKITVGEIYYYKEDGTYINHASVEWRNLPFTVTTTSDTRKIRFVLGNGNTNITPSDASNVQLEQGSTATDYVPYFNGGTATAEMLLKVGDYEDVQEILSGAITRSVGVKVLDGTEDWKIYTGWSDNSFSLRYFLPSLEGGLCTHYAYNSTWGAAANNTMFINSQWLIITDTRFSTITDWANWLKAQYAAGTPVIIVYPLATPTTESVAGQALQVQQGDNIVEITQASIDNLELEAKYQAAVTLTIQEVQDANLDPNVQVTIN